MFKDLFVLEKDRTAKEAFGFYLGYFVLILLVSFVIGYIGGSIGLMDYDSAYFSGWMGSIIFCFVLSFGILFKKKMLKSGFVLMAIFSGILAVLGGGLLGLIPTAYLTTIKKKIVQ